MAIRGIRSDAARRWVATARPGFWLMLVAINFAETRSPAAQHRPESPLIGDWALTLPSGEAGWLSVRIVDEQPRIELMWAVGGVRTINDGVSLSGSDLRFTFRESRQGGKTIHASVDGDTLHAKHVATSSGHTIEEPFRGKRMPPLPERPDLSNVAFGKPVTLFNGRDLTGWQVTDPSKKMGWSVRDGLLVNDTPKTDFSAYGDHANLRTEDEFTDFRLHIEFRVPPQGNSGIYLRGMYELQVVDRDSPIQGPHGPGAVYGRIAPVRNAGRPGGEWQSYKATLVDRHITVVLNGSKVIDNQPVAGPTGGALSSDVTRPGPIYLQGDHTSVAYRNIWLTPVLSSGR
jgi:hypothetical protein